VRVSPSTTILACGRISFRSRHHIARSQLVVPTDPLPARQWHREAIHELSIWQSYAGEAALAGVGDNREAIRFS
jgi:hypothetical protein